MTAPVVSVVVATFRRAHLLPRLVRALEGQVDAPPFEVLVVDNGSGDRTSTVLDGLRRSSPLALRPLTVARNRGPGVARDLGWGQARGRYVAFTDDDCVPSPAWLAAGVAALEAGAPVAVGRTAPAPDQERGPFSRTLVGEDTRFFQTANVFYRRADLDAVGGFDPTFRSVGGEDTDLAHRVLTHTGGEPVFVPDALVHHDVSPSDWRAAVRTAARWSDLPWLFRRHPHLRRALLHHGVFWKETHPATVLAVLGLALSSRDRRALAAVLPWVDLRLRRRPRSASRRERLLTLPQAFAVDVTEVVTMVRGSVRHRTLVL